MISTYVPHGISKHFDRYYAETSVNLLFAPAIRLFLFSTDGTFLQGNMLIFALYSPMIGRWVFWHRP